MCNNACEDSTAREETFAMIDKHVIYEVSFDNVLMIAQKTL